MSGDSPCRENIVQSAAQGSDLMGRSSAFNATLFFTALFGLLASFANSFTMLGIILFFLGSAVGVCLFALAFMD